VKVGVGGAGVKVAVGGTGVNVGVGGTGVKVGVGGTGVKVGVGGTGVKVGVGGTGVRVGVYVFVGRMDACARTVPIRPPLRTSATTSAMIPVAIRRTASFRFMFCSSTGSGSQGDLQSLDSWWGSLPQSVIHETCFLTLGVRPECTPCPQGV
jgi:hypothetical protein